MQPISTRPTSALSLIPKGEPVIKVREPSASELALKKAMRQCCMHHAMSLAQCVGVWPT